MKVGFLAPVNGFKEYGSIYGSIVAFLNKKGHEVIHPLSFNESTINKWSSQQFDDFFQDYYYRLNKSDLVIAECSYPCIRMGYEIANIIQQGKEVIVLKTKDSQRKIDSLYGKKNIYIYEYHTYNLKDVIEEAIAFNPNQKYKKYNILFTPEMVAKLNEIAKKKNLHKSVYIRQLIEKGLANDESH